MFKNWLLFSVLSIAVLKQLLDGMFVIKDSFDKISGGSA